MSSYIQLRERKITQHKKLDRDNPMERNPHTRNAYSQDTFSLLSWVLWHNNHCKLFNAKSYLYIKYIKFGLTRFYSISTLESYLRSNHIYDVAWLGFMAFNHCRLSNAKSSLYIHFKYMICEHILQVRFVNKLELFLHTLKKV